MTIFEAANILRSPIAGAYVFHVVFRNGNIDIQYAG